MSRKLRLGALLLTFCLLVGCGFPVAEEAEEPAAETVVEETKPEEKTPFGLAWEPDETLNPYDCMVLSNRTVLSLLYEPLFYSQCRFYSHAVSVRKSHQLRRRPHPYADAAPGRGPFPTGQP